MSNIIKLELTHAQAIAVQKALSDAMKIDQETEAATGISEAYENRRAVAHMITAELAPGDLQ